MDTLNIRGCAQPGTDGAAIRADVEASSRQRLYDSSRSQRARSVTGGDAGVPDSIVCTLVEAVKLHGDGPALDEGVADCGERRVAVVGDVSPPTVGRPGCPGADGRVRWTCWGSPGHTGRATVGGLASPTTATRRSPQSA